MILNDDVIYYNIENGINDLLYIRDLIMEGDLDRDRCDEEQRLSKIFEGHVERRLYRIERI